MLIEIKLIKTKQNIPLFMLVNAQNDEASKNCH